jgi:hypothetical protein
MTIQSHDGYWSTEATEIEQDHPRLMGFRAMVSAAGKHGEYAGVMINDSHLTITTARELAAALLGYADIAEQQAISEVAFSSEMVAGALS